MPTEVPNTHWSHQQWHFVKPAYALSLAFLSCLYSALHDAFGEGLVPDDVFDSASDSGTYLMMIWVIALLACTVPEVTSKCPTLASTNGTKIVNITWSINLWERTGGECTALVVGSSDNATEFAIGETSTIPAVNNDCIKFTCDGHISGRTFHYDQAASSCAYVGSDSQCSSQVKTGGSGGSCQENYTCYSAVFDHTAKYTYSRWSQYRHGWFAIFSGYTCGETGSGPCASDQCFNRFADPSKDDERNKACLNVNDTVNDRHHHVYKCKQKSTCDSDSYADLVFSHIGCNLDGRVVKEGTVSWSDACSHTVCVIDTITRIGKLVTSFKDHEGCVYEDQCVAVNDKVEDKRRYTCADLICRKKATLHMPFYFQVEQTGCLHGSSCYKKNDKIFPNETDTCDALLCNFNGTDNRYYWDHEYSGCYQPPGGSCTHGKNKLYKSGRCIKNKCIVKDYGRWKTSYKSGGKCVPSPDNCMIDGIPGCSHKNRCHPVKTVIEMDKCAQYVCYSDDKGLNSGTYNSSTPLPEWKPRATGCYGPTGCMKLGKQYLDLHTNNTYRCDYRLKGWGIKMAQFHKACVAPNGQSMPVGKSVYLAPVWYSCYRRDVMRAFNTSAKFIPATGEEDRMCGKHNGKWLLRGEPYFTDVGLCKKERRACVETCIYFDQPCEQTDLTPWRWIGDTYFDPQMNSQCKCTQDYNINNKYFTTSHFHTPALCSQEGVTDGACMDHKGKTKQWGEMWVRGGLNTRKVCTCHPLTRQAYCSTYLPDVNEVYSNMNIKKAGETSK